MQTEARTLGEVLPAITTAAMAATGSPALSIVPKTCSEAEEALRYLRALPDRLNDQQLAEVRDIARRSIPPAVPVSPMQFAKAMRRLSVLSRRADDDSTGEVRLEVYGRMLGHYPAEAIAYMTRAILATEQWFPSPAQCLRVIERWSRSDDAVRAQALARSRYEAENTLRWQELCDRFRRACLGEIEIPQGEIDALPDLIKRRLDCEMLLRFGLDGVWRVRRKPQPQIEAGPCDG
jgi:hypothetical protein